MKEDSKEVEEAKNHMEKITERAKNRLKNKTGVRQVTSDKNQVSVEMGTKYLKVGNVEKKTPGNNNHKKGSKWVELVLKRDMFDKNLKAILTYSEDSIAGNSEDRREYDPLELTADELVEYVDEKF